MNKIWKYENVKMWKYEKEQKKKIYDNRSYIRDHDIYQFASDKINNFKKDNMFQALLSMIIWSYF